MKKTLPVAHKAETNRCPVFLRQTTSRFLAGLLLLLPGLAGAQVQTPTTITPISLGTTAYTQDFNTLATTGMSSAVPSGFGFVETNAGTGTSADNMYTAVTITPTSTPSAGDTYSFGFGASASTDRAFGSIRSGSLVPQLGFAFTNTTGATITSLAVSYTGETYFLAGSTPPRNTADRLDFQYSTNATSLTAGTFVDVDPLDYNGPVNTNTTSTGYDGNDPANRTAVTGNITGLSIAAGATFYLRFADFDAAGSNDGLAIDDFSLTATTCNAAFAYSGSPFCQSGTNPMPTVTGTSGGAFSSTTGLTVDATTGTITLASSTAGTYTVTYTASATCSSTQSVTITAAPTAGFSYASTANYCISNPNTVAPTLATGATAGTFSSTTGLTINATTGAITPGSSTAGTYTVTNTVAAANGCAATSATTQVTINATPTATLTAGGPTTFCQGGSVVLTAPATAGSTYQFFNGPTSLGAASATNSFTATAGGSYTVTVTNSAGCSATSSPTTVTVNPATTATFAYSGATFCQSGTNPTPTVTGTTGGTFSSTTGLTIDAATGTITLASSTSGTYTVTYSVGGPCPSTGMASVTITAAPTAAFAYPTATTYCAGAANTVAPTLGAGTTAGIFSSTTGLTINATTGVITLSSSAASTYTVTNTVAAANGCAATSATTSVTITPATTATFAYSGATFCQSGTNPTPTVTGTSGGTFSSTTGLTIASATGALTLTSSTPGTYPVTYTVAGPCGSSTTASVTITAAQTAAFSYGTGTPTFCTSGATNPVATLGTGATAGTFSSTTGLTINATTGAITLSSSTPSTYTVTNMVAAANGCAAATATAQVTITAAPRANIGYSATSYCTTTTGTVALGVGTGSTLGTITVNPTTGLTIAANGTITPSTSTFGTYFVTNTVAASGGCAAVTGGTTVTITAAPVATFSFATIRACAGTGSTVTPTLAMGATAGTFSSTTGLTINATTGAINPTTSTAGTYTVTNTVAASGTCAAVTASATFTVNPRPATPTIAAAYNGNVTTLTSSAATGNQFYFNGNIIAGATGRTYVVNGLPSQLGSYTVTTTNANGCVSLPSAALVVTSSLKPLAGSSLSVYPNPTPNGILNVELTGYRKAVELTVLNALGQVVFTATVPASVDKITQQINLSQLPTGIYVLRAKTENGLDTRRVTKE